MIFLSHPAGVGNYFTTRQEMLKSKCKYELLSESTTSHIPLQPFKLQDI